MADYRPIPPNRTYTVRLRYRFVGRGAPLPYPLEEVPMAQRCTSCNQVLYADAAEYNPAIRTHADQGGHCKAAAERAAERAADATDAALHPEPVAAEAPKAPAKRH